MVSNHLIICVSISRLDFPISSTSPPQALAPIYPVHIIALFCLILLFPFPTFTCFLRLLISINTSHLSNLHDVLQVMGRVCAVRGCSICSNDHILSRRRGTACRDEGLVRLFSHVGFESSGWKTNGRGTGLQYGQGIFTCCLSVLVKCSCLR